MADDIPQHVRHDPLLHKQNATEAFRAAVMLGQQPVLEVLEPGLAFRDLCPECGGCRTQWG